MIYERRRLAFAAEALREVFRCYAEIPKQSDLPMGTITRVTVCPAAPVRVTVLIQQSGASRLREIEIAADKLLVALIYFCRCQRIPLPRNPVKSLSVAEGQIVLDLHMVITPSSPDEPRNGGMLRRRDGGRVMSSWHNG